MRAVGRPPSHTKRTAWNFISRASPPWLYVGPAEDEASTVDPEDFYAVAGSDVIVRRLDGAGCRTVGALRRELTIAFPYLADIDGPWPTLSECLAMVGSWRYAASYVVVVEHAEELLAEESQHLPALLRAFVAAGERLADDGADRALHTLLLTTPTRGSSGRLLRAAAAAEVGVRATVSRPAAVR